MSVLELSSKLEELELNPPPEGECIQDEEVWAAINSFFEENGINSAQIQSFNDLIHNKCHAIIDTLRHIKIEENGKFYTVEFGDLIFKEPSFTEVDDSEHPLFPMEALWRNITYSSEMYIDVTITPPTGEPTTYPTQYIGNMPVMVRSDLCNVAQLINDPKELAMQSEDLYDHGGYFIIAPKGESAPGATAQRRVLIPQERPTPNRVYIFSNRKPKPKYKTYAEIRSSGNGVHTTTTSVGINDKRGISCVLPWIDATEIPLGVLFYALGVTDEREMVEMSLGTSKKGNVEVLDVLIPALEYSFECDTQQAALHYIGCRGRKFMKEAAEDDSISDDPLGSVDEDQEDQREEKDRCDTISYARHLLSAELLPHLGQGEDTYHEKAKFLGYMVHKLISVFLGRRKNENRDHYMNKRVMTTGALLGQQFYGAFRRLIMEITNNTRKALRNGHAVNILSWIKPNIITNAMCGAISNNSWNNGGSTTKGISQLYEQFNYAAGIANMRKLTVPMATEGGKVIEPRDLHSCHVGIICPAETPEGKRVGLVKNMALMACITMGTNPYPVRVIIESILNETPKKLRSGTRIFLNGVPVGEVTDAKSFIKKLVSFRRRVKISPETSIAHFPEHSEIQISTEAGRLCRPLYVVEEGRLTFPVDLINGLIVGNMTWTELLATGTVELIDKSEEEHALLVVYPSQLEKMVPEDRVRITHCEMHPSMIFGIGGSIIPFPDHNQCVHQDEEVHLYGGYKIKIKDVVVGDRVQNFDPYTGKLGFAEVTKVVVKSTTKQMYRLTVEEGKTITATYDHRFITECGWRTLDMLKEGDFVGVVIHPEQLGFVFGARTFDEFEPFGEMIFRKVVSKTPVDMREIADITTDSPHQSFICGQGFGVHNSPRNTYQCIWAEELVLMANWTWMPIKNVKKGSAIITFSPETLKISKTQVIKHIVSPTTKEMVRITTERGDVIVVTVDHKMFTPFGWIPAGSLKKGGVTGIVNGGTVGFVYIAKMEPVPSAGIMIADITTLSNNHSFFAGKGGFAVHNSAMGKQAVGIPFTNYRQMMSGTFHTLQHVQRPLAISRGASIIRVDEMPAGQNAITAILPRPFNEEDSVEINQDSIDRGFMVSYKWVCYYAEIREEKDEIFGFPSEETCDKFKGDPSKLIEKRFEDDKIFVFAPPGTKVKDGDILIGRLSENEDSAPPKKKYTNSSVIYEHMWPATVDRVQIGTTGDGYKYIRVMTCQRREPVIGDKFCYSPDHDVLTSDGWIPIAELTKDHEVATLNPEGALEYQHPTKVMEYDYLTEEGGLIQVDTNQVTLQVTPNHKMYVKRRGRKVFALEAAEDLFDVHVHYKKDAVWEVPGLDYFELPEYYHESNGKLYPAWNLAIEPWLKFFGIWIAEGWANSIGVVIAINKKRVENALVEAFDEMGYEYKISDKRPTMYVYDKQLIDFMVPLSVGAIHKRLPEWVWELNCDQSRILLESMCLGDGHMNGNTPMYDTSSVGLKDDVMRLALHCGWAANSKIKSFKGTHKVIHGKDSVTNADAWRITIVKKQLEPAVNKKIKGQQTTIPYEGKIYCCTVPNHVLYIRNSSGNTQKPVWSGNSYTHGQKGTVGMKYRTVDFPFNSKGIVPDVIMNSLALPSRMTIAMLIEELSGKVVCSSSPLHKMKIAKMGLGAIAEDGSTKENQGDDESETWVSDQSSDFKKMFSHPKIDGAVDATPFRHFDINVIRREMSKYGYDMGDEILYDGTTGKPLRALVFFGPAFYQRLKHQVIDKMHARAKGGRTTMCRQPLEGRAYGGGLRTGCMERDCMLGQGASRFTRDRLMEQSDAFRIWVCDLCGLPAHVEKEGQIRECLVCGTNKVSRVKIPYGTKLINQELMALNIVPRIMPLHNAEEDA